MDNIIILGKRGIRSIDIEQGPHGYPKVRKPLFTIPTAMRYTLEDTGGFEYRSPKVNETIVHSSGVSNDWHHDGGDMHNLNGVVLWSNRYPTEFLLPNGDIFIPGDGEFVLFDNKAVRHRTNRKRELIPDYEAKPRHFIRAILRSYPSDELIEQWKWELALP